MCIVLRLSPEIFNVCTEFGAIVQSFPVGVLAAVWSSSPELSVKARNKCTNTSSSRCHSMSLLSLPRACFHLPELLFRKPVGCLQLSWGLPALLDRHCLHIDSDDSKYFACCMQPRCAKIMFSKQLFCFLQLLLATLLPF